MSIAPSLVRRCPLLLESDHLSLSKDLCLRGGALYDAPIAVRHPIQQPGPQLIACLKKGVTFQELERVSQLLGATTIQLNELLSFLNTIGALHRKRTFSGKLQAFRLLIIHAVFGLRAKPLTWRRPAGMSTVFTGVLRAIWPIVVAFAALSGVVILADLLPTGVCLIIGIFSLGSFVFSLWVHEMAHIAVIRHYRIQPQVLQHGLHLGIIHCTLPPKGEVISSLMGPLSGMGACTALTTLLSIQSSNYWLPGTIVASFHLFSLLPWYGDGASLYKALRTRT